MYGRRAAQRVFWRGNMLLDDSGAKNGGKGGENDAEVADEDQIICFNFCSVTK